MNSNSI